ncbi:hypothetical protein GRJ2_000279200 [Grus japonensis]|uniref:Uncharacterized protein n=1 Tax=Grus japonensis TaxID=30415 RepID=A0ABC9VXN0_GRUJA
MRIFSFPQHQNTTSSWGDPPAVSITPLQLKEILSGPYPLQAKLQGSDPASSTLPRSAICPCISRKVGLQDKEKGDCIIVA